MKSEIAHPLGVNSPDVRFFKCQSWLLFSQFSAIGPKVDLDKAPIP